MELPFESNCHLNLIVVRTELELSSEVKLKCSQDWSKLSFEGKRTAFWSEMNCHLRWVELLHEMILWHRIVIWIELNCSLIALSFELNLIAIWPELHCHATWTEPSPELNWTELNFIRIESNSIAIWMELNCHLHWMVIWKEHGLSSGTKLHIICIGPSCHLNWIESSSGLDLIFMRKKNGLSFRVSWTVMWSEINCNLNWNHHLNQIELPCDLNCLLNWTCTAIWNWTEHHQHWTKLPSELNWIATRTGLNSNPNSTWIVIWKEYGLSFEADWTVMRFELNCRLNRTELSSELNWIAIWTGSNCHTTWGEVSPALNRTWTSSELKWIAIWTELNLICIELNCHHWAELSSVLICLPKWTCVVIWSETGNSVQLWWQFDSIQMAVQFKWKISSIQMAIQFSSDNDSNRLRWQYSSAQFRWQFNSIQATVASNSIQMAIQIPFRRQFNSLQMEINFASDDASSSVQMGVQLISHNNSIEFRWPCIPMQMKFSSVSDASSVFIKFSPGDNSIQFGWQSSSARMAIQFKSVSIQSNPDYNSFRSRWQLNRRAVQFNSDAGSIHFKWTSIFTSDDILSPVQMAVHLFSHDHSIEFRWQWVLLPVVSCAWKYTSKQNSLLQQGILMHTLMHLLPVDVRHGSIPLSIYMWRRRPYEISIWSHRNFKKLKAWPDRLHF